MRKIKECGESFIVKIEKYGNVNHSPENPVWKIPRFCYLECINLALERGHFWPANPTVYTFTNFGQKYRKPINFCLVETEPGKHFTIKTFPGGHTILAWKCLEFLATTDKSFMRVGGNDVNSTFCTGITLSPTDQSLGGIDTNPQERQDSNLMEEGGA